MKNGVEIEVESTPVIDLSRHGLVDAANSGDDDQEDVGLPGEWDNEKTEVYTDSDEEGNASLVDADGEQYPITTFPYVLGRGNECDYVLTGKGVSRKHAEIVFQSGRFVVSDLNSLNGIKVNGYKVSRVILEEGDTIKLGDVSLTFSYGGEAKPQASKSKSLFGKSKEAAPLDDTFGDAPSKKIMKGAIAAATFLVVVGVGWLGFQQFSDSQRVEEQIVSMPKQSQTSSPAAKQQPATQQAQPQVAAASVKSAPSAIGAPPPSIAMAPIKPLSAQPAIQEPVAPKPVYKAPAPKPKPKPTVNKAQQSAQRLLASADSEFLNGNAPQLLGKMTQLENNSRVSGATKSKIRAKHEQIAKLYALYEKGQRSFVAGDKQGAFVAWSSFLEKESKAYGKRKSVYADQVTARVVDEYVERGNSASKQGEYHKAYKLWQKALGVGESVAAKIAIDNANNKSRQLYRKALRLEYVNSNKAKELWGEVVNLVPPGTEYHTKASSKLAWYDRWGA
ncbi:MAG: FHA domain-containing protein [Pseudomonadales bacterium]|nr:FHA domain-containing protein [Pseudomonadales bacterium]